MKLDILEILKSIDLNAMLDRIEQRILGDLPAEQREQIVPSLRLQIEGQIKEAIETGRLAYVFDTLLPRYGQDLRDAVARLPRRRSLSEQLVSMRHLLLARLWSRELEGLAPDCQIEHLGWHEVVTDEGNFTRAELREKVMATGFDRVTSAAYRRRAFASDEAIAEAEEAERQRNERAAVMPGTRAAGAFVTAPR